MQLEVGMPAPEFTLPLALGGTVSLANMRGKPVVLYFYPKDDTPGCTAQACSFRDNLPQFGYFDAAVIGISKDSVDSHKEFIKKYGLNFHLASDEESKTCEAYGVWGQKSMYGKIYMGIDRTTFLIDEKGIIRYIWRKVSVEGHAAEVLKLVDRLRLGQPLFDEPPSTLITEPKKAKASAKPAKKVALSKVVPPKPAKKVAPAKSAKKAVVKKAVPKKAATKKAAAKKVVSKKTAPKKASPKKKR
jgi:peroxiredoxin Q/BCP